MLILLKLFFAGERSVFVITVALTTEIHAAPYTGSHGVAWFLDLFARAYI